MMMKNLAGSQCGAVVGLHARDKEFLSGNAFNGVWYGDLESSARHQQEMSCASHGEYEALVVSPLTSGRIDNPDICLIYGTPGQMITLMNGLQYRNYKKYTFTCVGESACADSWGNALKTGEPSLSIPVMPNENSVVCKTMRCSWPCPLAISRRSPKAWPR